MSADVPAHPDALCWDLLVYMHAQVEVNFASDCVVELWRAPQNVATGSGSNTASRRSPDLFVKFQYARLRNVFPAQIRKQKLQQNKIN